MLAGVWLLLACAAAVVFSTLFRGAAKGDTPSAADPVGSLGQAIPEARRHQAEPAPANRTGAAK